ncbi:hypothetical protein RvY_03294 [Ramazzottius varieornatus]|uniref:Uncharacterized protein n=1 Tax=Ramazzottius varieornatus TaxID=947166 RepID=A0A1D1UUL2_RAMVA|nr:hypothetical protein RvY_03294 [Ramazzottius varieornatus]
MPSSKYNIHVLAMVPSSGIAPEHGEGYLFKISFDHNADPEYRVANMLTDLYNNQVNQPCE